MVELDETFRSLAEWTDWLDRHPFAGDAAHADRIGERILATGFVEPLTGIRVTPAEIAGKGWCWREGLVALERSSRLRAVMRVLAEKVGGRWRGDVSIYAAEALTGFALGLRGLFPRFLGSEFLPDPARRAALYPVPHQDLTRLDLPSAAFDLCSTNEVLEHVSDLDRALAELARILKPGGWHVGSVPFAFMSAAGDRRAELAADGSVRHLKPPEYHVNALDDRGALVFEIPGWDILERARRVGFSDAHMRFLAAPSQGVLGDNTGIHVLCLQRGPEPWPEPPGETPPRSLSGRLRGLVRRLRG